MMCSRLNAGRHVLKAQTSALLIMIVLIIFGSIAVFVVTISRNIDFDEYTNLYTSNLLIAMMRTDTGYTNPECKTVADLLICSYFTPEFRCGEYTCTGLAESTIQDYMSEFELVRKNYRYLFSVKPQGFISDTQVQIGEASLDCDPSGRQCPKIEKIVSAETIQSGSYVLKAQLIIAKK